MATTVFYDLNWQYTTKDDGHNLAQVETYKTLTASKIENFVTENIPKNSILNKVWVEVKAFQNYSSTQGDMSIYLQSSENTIGTQIDIQEGAVTDESKTISSGDIKAYFNSGTSNAGTLANDKAGIRIVLEATAARWWTVQSARVYWTFTPPNNNIRIGTSQPSKIYIDTQEVKEVYVGTTKVYG